MSALNTRLKAEIPVVALAPAGVLIVPHGLNAGGTPLMPDQAVRPESLTIVYSTTTLTITNASAAPVTFTVFVESWHTTERELGGQANLSAQPYEIVIPSPGSAPSAAGSFVPQAGPFFTAAPALRTGQAIFVNPADSSAVDDGDPATPKLTITGAIAAISQPGSELEQQRVWTIFVAGGCYDEDVVLPSFGVWLQMVALGRVTIGDGVLSGGGSTTPRDVTWQPEAATAFTTSTIVFSTLDAGETLGSSSTFASLSGGLAYGWRVSGDVVIADPGAGAALNAPDLVLSSTFIEGNFDTSGKTNIVVYSLISCFLVGNIVTGANALCVLIRGSVISGTIGPTANLRRIERSEVLGAITCGASQSAGEWFDSRPNPLFVLDPASAPPILDHFTASHLADLNWDPTLGPTPNEELNLIGVWGTADIGAAVGSVFPPPGNGATTATNIWGIGTTKTCFLAQVAVTLNAAADGDDISVDVLFDGSLAYTTGAFPSTGGVHNFDLYTIGGAMVRMTKTTRVSVRVNKLANITTGAVNMTVALYSY